MKREKQSQSHKPSSRKPSSRVLGYVCVGHAIYEVVVSHLPRDTLGQIDYEKRRIHVNVSILRDREKLLATIIHEIIHAILERDFEDQSAEKIASILDDRLAHALLCVFDISLRTLPS